MNILDLRTAWSDIDVETDVCILGSGPAGLTIARELVPTEASILVVESGGLEQEAEIEALSEIESLGASRDPGTVARQKPGLRRLVSHVDGSLRGLRRRGFRLAALGSLLWDGPSGAKRWRPISTAPRNTSASQRSARGPPRRTSSRPTCPAPI